MDDEKVLIRFTYHLVRSLSKEVLRQISSISKWSMMRIDPEAVIGKGVLLTGKGRVVLGRQAWLVGDSSLEVAGLESEISLGSNVRMEKGARLVCRGTSRIKIGTGSYIGEGVRNICDNDATVEFGKNVRIERFAEILSKGTIFMGDESSVGAYTSIQPRELTERSQFLTGKRCHISDHNVLDISGDITFGNDVRTGHYVLFHTHNHSFKEEGLIWNQPIAFNSISIGNGVWIGSSVTVLPAVEVGDHAILAAGSVVTRSVGVNEVVGGVPARVLKKRGPLVKMESS